MINLRPYQKEAIAEIKKIFVNHEKQFIELPTGSGKTVTFLSYAKENHKRILIVVPSKELLKQVYTSALIFFDKSEISRKGSGFNENVSKIHICIINSIKGKYLKFISEQHFDLLIIDEAHHIQASSYRRLIKNLIFSPKILGVTATPDRNDGKLISELLGDCSFRKNTFELIKEGYLSDIEGYSVKTKIDLSEVDSHNGDFSLRDLFNKLCVDSRNELILNIIINEMKDRKNLIFCINVEHSKIISKLLNQNGISCSHIDGKMDEQQRHSILSAFRNREISCLTNCQLLTEGFDESSIDGIILARPTKSRSLFNQMIGRGLRIHQGKVNCKVIDIVDNHRKAQGFNSLVTDEYFEEIQKFKNINDIHRHIGNERLKIAEFTIEKINIFNELKIHEKNATESMIDYLKENNIKYFEPVSFDEGSFMIWMNELKKEYQNGIH